MTDARRIYLAAPGYGHQTAAAGRGIWLASRNMSQVTVPHLSSSLLAANFNGLWCSALNEDYAGKGVDYFAMLHSDIGPEDFWLDALIEELEQNDLDVLSVAVPIKDQRGLTSCAVDGDSTWRPQRRITMRELASLPETFSSEHVGGPLLVNTGCWVCRFDAEWVRKVFFTVNDRIVFNKATDRYLAQCEPEDWFFSRLCHELELKVGATRKIRVSHRGEIDFSNQTMWGKKFDDEYSESSFLEHHFPADVEGWLSQDEGACLGELCDGKNVVEIGSYAGRSSICIAQRAASLSCVDFWDGRATPNPKSTREDFIANVERYGVSDKITLYEPTDDLPEKYYDVVFIDGDHDYQAVKLDIEMARILLKRDGVIAFHDYQADHPGVDQAVDELLAAGGELLERTNTVAVLRPPVVCAY